MDPESPAVLTGLLPARTAAGSSTPHVARHSPLAFERQRARDDMVEEDAIVADEQHACRANSTSSSSSSSSVSMSRSLVGSSSTSTLAGRANSRASSSRLRSPPDSAFTGERARSCGNRKSREVADDVARLRR